MNAVLRIILEVFAKRAIAVVVGLFSARPRTIVAPESVEHHGAMERSARELGQPGTPQAVASRPRAGRTSPHGPAIDRLSGDGRRNSHYGADSAGRRQLLTLAALDLVATATGHLAGLVSRLGINATAACDRHHLCWRDARSGSRLSRRPRAADRPIVSRRDQPLQAG